MADRTPEEVYAEIEKKIKAGQSVTDEDTAALNYAQYLESNRSSRRSRITDAVGKIYSREWKRHAAIKQRLNQWKQHSDQDVAGASQQNRLAGMLRGGQALIGSAFRGAARVVTYAYHKIKSLEARRALMRFHEELGTTADGVRRAGVHISNRGFVRSLVPAGAS